jgi:hypothetical protein
VVRGRERWFPAGATLALACSPGPEQGAAPLVLDQGENGIWMRRHWLHGGPEVEGHEQVMRQQLAEAARANGLTRLYPFLGPMDWQGWPGWRRDGFIHRYDPTRVQDFTTAMAQLAPDLRIIPWTGGTWPHDVLYADRERIEGFVEHTRVLTHDLGVHGVQLNVEPQPSYTQGFLELLAEVQGAIGPDKVLSVAAYPPPTLHQPVPEVHWTLPFLKDVCLASDELAVMAYDTGLEYRWLYRELMERWTRELAQTLPPPEEGGCVWLVGLPAYEDDEPWHDPGVETIDEAIKGVVSALEDGTPSNFRGVAVYASWTTDATEWAAYDQLWRPGTETPAVTMPDLVLPDGS